MLRLKLAYSCTFLLLIGCPQAHAIEEKDCGEIRLDQNGGAFEQMPVYDQRVMADEETDTGMCYAVASAQLIDAYRFSQEGKLPAQLTSPFSLALNRKYADLGWFDVENPAADPEQILGMGVMTKTMALAKQQPVCDQNWLDKFEGSRATPSAFEAEKARLDEILNLVPTKRNFLRAVSAEVENYRKYYSNLPLFAGLRKAPEPEVSGDFFSCRVEEGTIPIKDLLGAIKAGIKLSGHLSSLHSFFAEFCAKHSFQPKFPEPTTLDRTDLKTPGKADLTNYRLDQLERAANFQLSAKPNHPVGISYCMSLLVKSPGALVKDGRLGLEYKCDPHSSVIIGRRFKNNSCEFLVRNSLGPDCKNLFGEPRYAWDCENGSVWVDSKELMKSTFQLNWL